MPYSTGGAPYPITSTKIMTAPTATATRGATGGSGGSTGVGAGATTTPSTSPIDSSSAGVAVLAKGSVDLALFGVVVGMMAVVCM